MVDITTLPVLAKEEFGGKYIFVWDGTSPFANYRAMVSDTGVTGGTSTTIEEKTRDVVAAALVAGTGIDITVDDVADTITIAAESTGGGIAAGAGIDITTDGTTSTVSTEVQHVLVADQAAYDALTPASNTLYYIPEA